MGNLKRGQGAGVGVGVGLGCGFGIGWGFGGAPLGILGASMGGGCGVGLGLGFGAGVGLGSWYIPEESAFQDKKKQNKIVKAIRKIASLTQREEKSS
ncbi:hypothetical protein HOP50_09g54570 [Chloropicon primus]|uniref:Uncharacterized protein n=1 Tax=Chloropicon primus TaxID=1764295 RepID=A0A5B8MQC9_9CHLO|nr:hypothetical protein A3770_09p54260 [Chloropicon primus]UPR02132.1 hypothetical protein HOP50_09g54570 [Chloropicon primus]|eukprot:QDZ22908.1 hypothetical protein A3770_09p54260 [Chloropicon primus]